MTSSQNLISDSSHRNYAWGHHGHCGGETALVNIVARVVTDIKSTHPHATTCTVDEMKERPKVGDRVKFRYRGVKIGRVVAVAETGVHFLIEMSGYRYKYVRRLIGINAIIEILPPGSPR